MTDSTRLSLDPGPDRTRSLLGWPWRFRSGAAVSLGITRFAYGLLLPAMRADLGWSYTLAGAMNTVNALGYLGGALLVPRLLRRVKPAALLLWGALAASVFMGLSGFFHRGRALAGAAAAGGVGQRAGVCVRRVAGGAAGGAQPAARGAADRAVLRRHGLGHLVSALAGACGCCGRR
jgi:predicted MFS family arabinose efflux permease